MNENTNQNGYKWLALALLLMAYALPPAVCVALACVQGKEASSRVVVG